MSIKLQEFSIKLENTNGFKEIIKNFKTNNTVYIKNLSGSLLSILINTLRISLNQKIVFVSNNNQKLDDVYHDFRILAPNYKINIVKEPQSTLRSKIHNQDTVLDWLLEGIISFKNNSSSLLLCQTSSFIYSIPDKEKISIHYKSIAKGDNINYDEFIKDLMLNGFERMEYVSGQGQIAIRGGIVDLFPIGWDNPLRVEFWGNDIDSIREFEVISQRSIREYESVEFLNSMFSDNEENSLGSNKNVFDYLGYDSLFILDDSVDYEEFRDYFLNQNTKLLIINSLTSKNIVINSNHQPSCANSIKLFVNEINRLVVENYQVFLACESKIHLDRFKSLISKSIEDVNEITNDYGFYLNKEISENVLNWESESLSKGFYSEELKLAYFTEHEVFSRLRINDSHKKKKNKGLSLVELQELKIGDYVVHEDKGIGIFDGFQTIVLGDSKQDCARVKFADGDMLYVHLNYINKLSKYSAQEGATPILSKLGSTDWLRRKERTKKRLKDIARDLIKLYAERKSLKGYAFPLDTIWQNEFEASFIYEDTPDQASATAAVKTDMESNSPMDRLICGDVGFGKTEVAIRAAFKAAQAGKQSAVLVPTTILAQQHFMSFKDRIGNYPVNIEVISRFRTKKEQTQIIENVKSGKIDILIGTHRILSKDINFKNLGLLVVDEEHRFGVSHKEKLRQLRTNIDTLTLTATPIPRTLNFSLMGARDLSLIETPPRNRIPVQTEIMEWDNDSILEAINREIERGGQVFFVSDRIEDINKIADDLKKLMPFLRIVVGHGQMKPSELEDIMEKFTEGKYDVLVATKIIESGIDIPNANTMLINRAHNFGLAELYQLRGRVGRSNIEAYCYLIIPPAHKLPQRAIQRLQAIEEFTELGSGFKLSMRDLEIRGAGNLLGAEQSGFIVDIGFELYQKVLEEAVNELKFEEFSDIFDENQNDGSPKYLNEEIAIEIDEDAFIPSDYIKGDTERFMYYKKLYSLKSISDLNELLKEIIDKYGKIPKEVKNLIFVVKLRIASMATGFTRIVIKKDRLICEFPPKDFKDYYDSVFQHILDYLYQTDGIKLNQKPQKLLLEIPMNNRNQALEYIWKIKKIIEINLD